MKRPSPTAARLVVVLGILFGLAHPLSADEGGDQSDVVDAWVPGDAADESAQQRHGRLTK